MGRLHTKLHDRDWRLRWRSKLGTDTRIVVACELLRQVLGVNYRHGVIL